MSYANPGPCCFARTALIVIAIAFGANGFVAFADPAGTNAVVPEPAYEKSAYPNIKTRRVPMRADDNLLQPVAPGTPKSERPIVKGKTAKGGEFFTIDNTYLVPEPVPVKGELPDSKKKLSLPPHGTNTSVIITPVSK